MSDEQLPTSGEFFGVDESNLPTAGEFFGEKRTVYQSIGSGFDSVVDGVKTFGSAAWTGGGIYQKKTPKETKDFYEKTALGRVLASGKEKAREAFSGPDFTTDLNKDIQEAFAKDDDFQMMFLNDVIYPVAKTAEVAAGLLGAAYAFPTAAVSQIGEETGSDGAKRFFNDLAAMPDAFMGGEGLGPISAIAESRSAARAGRGAGKLDGAAAGLAKVADEAAPVAAEMAVKADPPRPPTTGDVARQLAPNLFEKYDALEASRNDLRTQLNALSDARTAEIDAQIEAIRAEKKGGFGKIQALEAKRAAILEAGDTPEMMVLRKQIMDADFQMRDLSPQVSAVMRDIGDRQPTLVEAVSHAEEPLPAEAIKAIEDQKAFIVNDFTQRAIAAGSDAQLANAVGQLEAARYETLAKQLGKDSAEALYKEMSADVVDGGDGGKRLGKIKQATENTKATITLFEKQNFSTLVHEKGHEYVNQVIDLAKKDGAPEQIVRDAETLKKYAGVGEDGRLTRAGQEKLARGFERYAMEGVAPTKELANAFFRFKQWLSSVYQSVKKLKSPINEDIRAVFDRFFTENVERTIIDGPLNDGRVERTAANDGPKVSSSVDRVHGEAGVGALAQDNAGASQGNGRELTEGVAGRNAYAELGLPEKPVEGPSARDSFDDVSENKSVSVIEPERMKAAVGEKKFIDKAGNIRLDNVDAPEDVLDIIRESAETGKEFTEARRGVITDQETIELADALGMTPDKLDARKLGEAFNAEQIVAARKLLIQSATEVRDLMKRAADGTDADVLAYARARERHMMIQEQVSGITAEAGRALRAFRALDGMSEAKALGAFLEESVGLTLNQLQQEARLGATLDTPSKISAFMDKAKRPDFKSMVIEYWYGSVLSGLLTHVKNASSGFIMALWEPVETTVAAGIGKAKSVVNKDVDRVYISEAKAQLFAIRQGSVEGWAAAKYFFKHEKMLNDLFGGQENLTAGERNKFEAIPSKKITIGGKELEVGGKQVRLPGRVLGATDLLFKCIAYRQEVNRLAVRAAEKEGLIGEAFAQKIISIASDPSPEIMMSAKKKAAIQTLTNELGDVGKALQRLSNSHPIAKIVLPFIKTPINSLKYANERTVLGVLSEEPRGKLLGRAGSIAQDEQLARVALGSSLSVVTASFALDGTLTGSGPSNRNDRAALMLTGWRPYSVKIGETYYSYAWMEPLSTIIGVTADLAELSKSKELKDKDIEEIASKIVGSISKNVIGKLSLKGASDFINLLTDPDKYGEKYIQQFSGAFVPNILGQTARAIDPEQRQINTTIDALKSKVPFLRENLMAKRDVWGEPMENQGTLGPDMISPIYMSKMSNDPVNKAINDLGMGVSMPSRKVEGVELSDEQYDEYVRLSGRFAKKRLDSMVGVLQNNSLPIYGRQKMVETTLSSSRLMAKQLIMAKYPQIKRDALKKRVDKITAK